MTTPRRSPPGLFVASRGTAPVNGLHHYAPVSGREDATWVGGLVTPAPDLACLGWHPRLPVVFGLSGLGRGRLLTWSVQTGSAPQANLLADLDCGGEIPCDVAADPQGRLVVGANFGSGSLTVWRLDEHGVPQPHPEVLSLQHEARPGSDPERQDRPHPHQIVFAGGLVLVPDYGSDQVRRFVVDHRAGGSGSALVQTAPLLVPAGTAPRHLWWSPSVPDRVGMSGELASSYVFGPVDGSDWRLVPSTTRSGPARSRPPRNYPGDIKLSADGRRAYLANRGYDTIAVFDARGGRLLTEVDAGCAWPQHLLLAGDSLLVAGWDSSEVVRFALDRDGIPTDPVTLFACPGAGWLLAEL